MRCYFIDVVAEAGLGDIAQLRCPTPEKRHYQKVAFAARARFREDDFSRRPASEGPVASELPTSRPEPARRREVLNLADFESAKNLGFRSTKLKSAVYDEACTFP